jgi:hypothetical protein
MIDVQNEIASSGKAITIMKTKSQKHQMRIHKLICGKTHLDFFSQNILLM